jgi:hypothetical protein
MIVAVVISLPYAPYISISFCGIELLAECHVRPVGYSYFRAFSIASAQPYASVATLLCPTLSLFVRPRREGGGRVEVAQQCCKSRGREFVP